MKILIGFISIFLFLTMSFCFAENDLNYLYFQHDGQVVGKVLMKDFQAMVLGAKEYLEILDAEANGRVKIELKDNPWSVTTGDTFKTDVKITWQTKDGQTTKEMIIGISMKTKIEPYSNMVVLYRDVASWGFPFSVVLNIILIIALSL